MIGSHTSFEKTIFQTVKSSIQKGLYSSQFFLGSPQAFQRYKPTDIDISDTQALIDRYPMPLFTHYPYVANLAGSKDCLAWNGDTNQDMKTTNVLSQLQHELDTMAHFKNSGVVIHPGNYTERTLGLESISTSINKLQFKPNSCLILENSAGQGTSLATTLDEIAHIIKSLDNPSFVGVCLDTCHLHAYGEYDITQKGEVDRLINEFQVKIGLEKLKLIHLNDSIHERGSRKDRHERIGQGTIWKKGKETLYYLLDQLQETPFILETVLEDFYTLK